MEEFQNIQQEEDIFTEPIIALISEKERNRVSTTYLRMMTEFDEEKPGRDLLFKSECIELLVLAHRKILDLTHTNEVKKASKSWIHIENAMEYVLKSKTSHDLKNVDIAAHIGVSANYLTRIFQEKLGISRHQYVMNIRIERAQQILLSDSVNVTEAANLVGFSSIHAFSRCFKKMFGVTPSQFINETVTKKIVKGI